jgi:hypothetical protein
MLDAMNQRVKNFAARTACAALLFWAAASVQSQDVKAGKTDEAGIKASSVTLSMRWLRGDLHYGPNFISLASPCQPFAHESCECTMDFKGINSIEFADYIASFGDARVPVVFEVVYGPDLLAQRARLNSVGSWRADRFQVNDRLLGITFKWDNTSGKHTLRFPAECFPPREN